MASADRGVPRPVGRTGGHGVRGRGPRRCPRGPQRIAAGGLRGHNGSCRRAGIGGRRDPVHRRRDRPARAPRARPVPAGRATSSRDPRGHRGEGVGPADDADPRRGPPHPRRPRRCRRCDGPRAPALSAKARYLAGLDAERARLDIKTMAVEGHEPLWSMGDDTPTAGRGRLDRPVADHLRQAFAQVTNPAIDPERERAVMDLRVELGRRPACWAGRRAGHGPFAWHGRSSWTSTASSARCVSPGSGRAGSMPPGPRRRAGGSRVGA